MPSIKDAAKLYLGGQTITAAYLGADNVWPVGPAAETWTGDDGSAWPAQWATGATGTGAAVQLSGNRGALTTGSSGTGVSAKAYLSGMSATGDTDVTVDIISPSPTLSQTLVLALRTTDAPAANSGNTAFTDAYVLYLYVNAGAFAVYRVASGASTSLVGSIQVGAWTANVARRVRFQALGDTIKVKVWDPAAAEPAAWSWSGTDSALSAVTGRVWVGLSPAGTAANRTIYLDNLTVAGDDLIVSDGGS